MPVMGWDGKNEGDAVTVGLDLARSPGLQRLLPFGLVLLALCSLRPVDVIGIHLLVLLLLLLGKVLPVLALL